MLTPPPEGGAGELLGGAGWEDLCPARRPPGPLQAGCQQAGLLLSPQRVCERGGLLLSPQCVCGRGVSSGSGRLSSRFVASVNAGAVCRASKPEVLSMLSSSEQKSPFASLAL